MIYVVIEILLVVAAGVVIGTAIRMHRINEQIIQDQQPIITTNTVSTTYILSDTYDGGTSQTTFATLSPTYWTTNEAGRFLTVTPDTGFTIQYGLDANSNTFCYTTNEIAPIDYVGNVVTNWTSSNMLITVTLNGPGGGVLMYNILTNQSSSDDDEIDLSYGANSGTDVDGDTGSWSPTAYTTNVVIIQRSTNLTAWVSISTNEVNPGYVNYYTDFTIFTPTMTTYYDTSAGSGGGSGILPGTGGGSSTNGIISVPGQAFYRVEYPSNQAYYIGLFSD